MKVDKGDVKEWIKALEAIEDDYPVEVSDGFIVVENPEATPSALALGGVNPKLVVDCALLRKLLQEGVE